LIRRSNNPKRQVATYPEPKAKAALSKISRIIVVISYTNQPQQSIVEINARRIAAVPRFGPRLRGRKLEYARRGGRAMTAEPAHKPDVSLPSSNATKFGSRAVGLFSKEIESMDDLFLHVLQDIYYTENQIVKALPDMINKATNRELTAAFKSHLSETKKQVQRLEQAFALLGQPPKRVECRTIDGLIDETNQLAGEIDDKKVLDAALLAAAQAVEHYEISRYGTLIAWSDELGKEAVGKLLATTLKEEKAADKKSPKRRLI
jgi:ferritin-like metal-binding protein YciE